MAARHVLARGLRMMGSMAAEQHCAQAFSIGQQLQGVQAHQCTAPGVHAGAGPDQHPGAEQACGPSFSSGAFNAWPCSLGNVPADLVASMARLLTLDFTQADEGEPDFFMLD